jgi:pseudouridine-5'-phosphate glycosidase
LPDTFFLEGNPSEDNVSLTLAIHPEVQAVLEQGGPMVALESTLITHGFAMPDNLKIARAIEETVREQGAIPATIAILSGQIHIGLTPAQLEYLGTAPNVRKCSRRDLPLVVARGEDGATTVAGTMIVAHLAGIRLLATGGIGGVHRSQSFDASADLLELGRTPITVVCAGAKAILDLPLTLEVLETHGVPVIGYQTNELPAFYSRQSGLPVDLRVDTPAEVAAIIHAREALGLDMGLLVTVPIPLADEWPAAERKGITGKAVTPYLLQRVSELSGERSKQANMSLLLNNARVAAQIARALV